MQIHYPAGTPILRWLANGPRMLDVSDRYVDNYFVPFEPYRDLWDAATGAMQGVRDIQEGAALTFFDQEKAWRMTQVHEAEQRLTWAEFGVRATLMATALTLRLRVDRPGTVAATLQVNGSVWCSVNDTPVLEKKQVGRVGGSYALTLPLKDGWNDVSVLLFNVHLHCLNTLQLKLDVACEVELALLPLPEAVRMEAERAMAGAYLTESVLLPGKTICLEAQDIPEGSSLGWALSHAPRHETPRALGQGLCQGMAIREEIAGHGELPRDGEYVLALWCEVGGVRLEGPRLSIQRVSLIAPALGQSLTQRKQTLLERFAREVGGQPRNGAYRAFCQIACGLPVDEADIRGTLDYINARIDCADFALHGLLRLHMKYGDHPALSEQLRQEIKACILNFKYWVDEPGRSMMFTRSENHEILFYSAEYLAGLAFPLEIFPNSGQNGLFHELKGRMRAQEWIREKGHFGFTEWHSNSYYEEDLLALANIWEFGEENGLLRQYARQLLDLIALFIGANSHQGIMATTHGRCYEMSVMHPCTEPMSRINWLLFGVPKTFTDSFSIGAAILADSPYLPPEAATAMAISPEPLETRSRMGLFRSKGLGGVNCSTYRTQTYMVSGLVTSNYGEHGAQVQAGQALLDAQVPVFVTCFADRAPNTRPSYWGGQHVIPKTIACRNVLAYVVNLEGNIGYSHCYFPETQMDETVTRGAWRFGRKGEAYVAVHCSKPYDATAEGAYKGRELLCLSKRAVWIFELGDKAQWGTFEAFQEAILAARLEPVGEALRYHSPSLGECFFDWDGTCTREGTPFLEADFPLLDNAYVTAAYGSGLIQARAPYRTALNFF